MNPKWIARLQKVFWLVGWAVLVLTAGAIAMQAYEYFSQGTAMPFWPKKNFDLLNQIRLLFGALGQAFFAFLMSSIFGMIVHRAPAHSSQTEAFLRLTCIGFIGEGVFGLIGWARWMSSIIPPSIDSILEILSGLGYLLGVFSISMSFVYAIAIYVLYRHFSQLVTFESEVV